MARWLSAAFFAATACAPRSDSDSAEILCRRLDERCPVVVERSDYWSEPPAVLGSGEVVVEAVAIGGYVATTRSQSSEYLETSSGEAERICTMVRPIIVQDFKVTRVVVGVFEAPTFGLLQSYQGCTRDDIVQLNLHSSVGDKPAYLVIRPAPATEGIDGRESSSNPPLMVHRPEGVDILP